MSLPTSRGSLLVGAAAAALLVVAVVALQDNPAAPVAPPSNPSSASRAASPDIAVADVRLEALTADRGEPAGSTRNPFRFQARPAPPPARAAASAPRAPTFPEPVVPSGPPPPAPIPLRFIGVMEAPTQAGRLAILSDGRGNVFYGKEGDIIEGRYKVLKIGPDAAELSHVDGRGRQMIRLSGQ